MRIINHIETDTNPTFWDADDKWMDNRNEPVVRIGGEVYESHYESDCHLETYIADPRRSFVKPLYLELDKWVDGAGWLADFLACFLLDLGFDLVHPTKAMIVAFWTMFPRFLSFVEFKRWMGHSAYNNQVKEMPRVINNPFFYSDSNAAETRLLEIAQDGGFTYAIDLAKESASAETLAREIARLNHIHEGDAAVESAYGIILPQVADVLT